MVWNQAFLLHFFPKDPDTKERESKLCTRSIVIVQEEKNGTDDEGRRGGASLVTTTQMLGPGVVAVAVLGPTVAWL